MKVIGRWCARLHGTRSVGLRCGAFATIRRNSRFLSMSLATRRIMQKQSFTSWVALTLAALLSLSALIVAQTPQAPASPAQNHPDATPQDQSAQTKMVLHVKMVTLLATVRDKHGKISSNLGKDDFALQEDGRPQVISYFARETDVP